jgi:hypothetical protein
MKLKPKYLIIFNLDKFFSTFEKCQVFKFFKKSLKKRKTMYRCFNEKIFRLSALLKNFTFHRPKVKILTKSLRFYVKL